MKPKKLPLSDFFEGFKLVTTCPACNEQYDPAAAELIEEHGELKMVHVTCRKCAHAVVALIVASPMGVSSMTMMTDCTPDDLERLRSVAAISSDDLLTLYSDLHKEKFLERLFD